MSEKKHNEQDYIVSNSGSSDYPAEKETSTPNEKKKVNWLRILVLIYNFRFLIFIIWNKCKKENKKRNQK